MGTNWAIRVLHEHDFVYDASVFPARTSLYGIPDAPLAPYQMSLENPAQMAKDGLLEVPMSVFPLGPVRIGFTGGLYGGFTGGLFGGGFTGGFFGGGFYGNSFPYRF